MLEGLQLGWLTATAWLQAFGVRFKYVNGEQTLFYLAYLALELSILLL